MRYPDADFSISSWILGGPLNPIDRSRVRGKGWRSGGWSNALGTGRKGVEREDWKYGGWRMVLEAVGGRGRGEIRRTGH